MPTLKYGTLTMQNEAGETEYIHPRTDARVVKSGDSTVEAKLTAVIETANSAKTSVDDLKNPNTTLMGNSTSYTSAGESVRAQIGKLSDEISNKAPTKAEVDSQNNLIFKNGKNTQLFSVALPAGTTSGEGGTATVDPASFLQINTSRNNIFRGKDLGVVSSTNIDQFITDHGISTGTFNDIYVGDYFTISYTGSNKVIRVAGFDLLYKSGDTALNKHHIVCVPDATFLSAAMNSTNTTGVSANKENPSEDGAYAGSDMYNLVIPTIDANLEAVFGTHLLSHREILSKSIDPNCKSGAFYSWGGASNNRAWYDVKSVLMNEVEVYGTRIFSSSCNDTGILAGQLPLFRLEPKYIFQNRYWWWLRDVSTSSIFACVSYHGDASYGGASGAYGVRPRFLIG